MELLLLNIRAVLLVSWYKSAYVLFWSVLHETDSFDLAPYFCSRRSFSLHKSSVQMWFSYFLCSEDNFGSSCVCTRLDWRNTNWPSSMLSPSRWGLNKAAPYPSCAQRAYSLVCILHPPHLHLGHVSTLALFLHFPSHALQRVHPLRASWKVVGQLFLSRGASSPLQQVFAPDTDIYRASCTSSTRKGFWELCWTPKPEE